MRPYEGLLTAMVTPFHPDGRVNEDAAVAMGRHLLRNGSDGLVVAGTTGEAATLTDEEQIELVRTIAQELGSEGAIVAGAGSNDTRHGIHLTEGVIEAGAHAVLSVTPYYNKPNHRGIHAHFSEISKAAGDTPVILYNIPGRTATNMPPELLRSLAQLPNVVAVKQANAEELQPIEGLELLAGNDDDLARTLDRGGAGGICVASHIIGNEMKRLFEVDGEERARLDAELKPVYKAMFITASPAPVKAALKMLGHEVGGLRLPLVECDPDETEFIFGVLSRAGLLDRAGAPAG
jgi:4-hydroxy-tetrahydrodipicolinate synthase